MRLTRRDLVWIVPASIAAGFFGWLGWRVVYIQFLKTKVSEPKWRDGAKVKVAPVGQFDRDWKFYYFEYPLAKGNLKAVLFRLPRAVPGSLTVGEVSFLALSRICTHQGCTVTLVDTPELGSIAYNYRTDHPFLGCPCHFGAFEPLQAGAAVYGPPRYPLPRIRLMEEAGELYATGHEVPLRPIEQS